VIEEIQMKSRNHIRLLYILAIVAVAACLHPGASSAQLPQISVSPDSLIVGHNTPVTLDIVVSSETAGLMGYDISITFDGDIIRLQNVFEGTLPLNSGFTTFFDWLNPTLPSDSVHVNGGILGNTVDGPGVLFTLTFDAYSPDNVRETDVRIVLSTIRDGVNQDIVHTVKHGWVRVEPSIRTESTTWGRVKSLYREHERF